MDAEGQSFEFVARAASNAIYDLSSQLRKAQTLTGRSRTVALAKEMDALGSIASHTTDIASRAAKWPGVELSPAQRQQQKDLSSQLERLLHGAQELQANVTQKLKQSAAQANGKRFVDPAGGTVAEPTESTPLIDPTEQAQVQQQVLDELDESELGMHTALIEDRDTQISEIQRGTREINSIFQDLGILVAEQGQQLDTVEDNIADLARQTEQAGRQLQRAEAYQRGRGKWTCIALLVLLVITVLVALSVLS